MSNGDSLDQTHEQLDATIRSGGIGQSQVPERVGRYLTIKQLGKGSFGLVLLSQDEHLNRLVAVKIPHAHLISCAEDVQAYISEAQMVANLDHPNIVPVHDVGSAPGFPCYIVSKYIDGCSLNQIKGDYYEKYSEIASLVATVADALHYAHKQGLVHRDVKPGNMLIDQHGKPYVVDFGLAMKEEDIGKGPKFVGTPAYMSPEQAVGEGHRVDGRSDIYSLGVVMYELLTHRRTFLGDTRSQILEQIVSQEPKPPRQIVDTIPKQLERICLKALSRRASDRFTTARDFADELRESAAELSMAGSTVVRSAHASSWVDSQSLAGSFDSQAVSTRNSVRMVPKGLRSFDEHDADFFLALLPDPRDRHGLPQFLRFWKSRVEQRDVDKTFPAGLIYGPSGCGKSSLLKAGLLPLLSDHVVAIYMEATGEGTEARLLHRLRKEFPDLPTNLGLKDSLAHLRRRETFSSQRKLLIVIDQFEQWLHSNAIDANSELVQALRQCDGGTVQCIVMVRDDFWMAATRFMRELEVQLVEGHNLSGVDLFPERHAREVLAAFGKAYGALPEDSSQLSDAQREFVKQAVSSIADDGKVVCVRLALFADMMKGKTWEASSLKNMGGTTGVGVQFLDETFHSATASPEHRLHEQAARAVLKALLPTAGTNIKGEMKSYDELMAVSGYMNRPRDFAALMKILDSEVRLITPTDSLSETAGAAHPTTPTAERYFQLTHDYVVPALREWLTRNQRTTRRGRAELCLSDRSAAWNLRSEVRQLPSLWEYLNIRVLTDPKTWTSSQRPMMRAAATHYARLITGFGLIGLCLIVSGLFLNSHFRQVRQEAHVESLIDKLEVAKFSELESVATELQNVARLAIPKLEAMADDDRSSPAQKLRANFVLTEGPGVRCTQLIHSSLTEDHQVLQAVGSRVAPYSDKLARELWNIVQGSQTSPAERLRAAALVAVADPQGRPWLTAAPAVVDALLAENSVYVEEWLELLRPAAWALSNEWQGRLLDESRLSTEQMVAARALARYADAARIGDLLLNAPPEQVAMLFPGTSNHRQALVQRFRQMLIQPPAVDDSQDKQAAWSSEQLRNAVVVLLRLREFDAVDQSLTADLDPSIRSKTIRSLHSFGVEGEVLVEAYQAFQNPSSRQVLLLAAAQYSQEDLDRHLPLSFLQLIEERFSEIGSSAEHSAIEYLIRGSQAEVTIESLIAQLCQQTKKEGMAWLDESDWWVNSAGQTMLVISGPIEFPRGASDDPKGTEHVELTTTIIPRSFAASAHEVTIEQYKRFRPNAEFAGDVIVNDQCPANKISVLDAMQYCRWLSEQELIAEDQYCYPPLDEINLDSCYLTPEQLNKTGYRLLTEHEYECICRANSRTQWFCGSDDSNLSFFSWYAVNSSGKTQPVGSLMPNGWGFFDITGNVSEWCQPSDPAGGFVLRGGSFTSPSAGLRSAQRVTQSNTGYSFTGFRIACTVAPQHE